MARHGGFSVDDEEVLETVARMLSASAAPECVSILKHSRIRFEQTGFDNWNGGTLIYTLILEIAAEVFVGLGDRREKVQDQIGQCLNEAAKQFRSGWYDVELAPVVVAIPGRPDLQGGPLMRRTRTRILQFLLDRGGFWRGELGDLEFLEAIFDLEALPSTDPRFPNAVGDIWQHRVNNPDDWPENWVLQDERFSLEACEDSIFLRFVERLLSPDVRPSESAAAFVAAKLNEELRESGWSLVQRETLEGDVRWRVEPWRSFIVRARDSLRTSAVVLSSAWMHQEVARIESALDKDPALAIGTAKETVETCCKHIADALSLPVSDKPDFPTLIRVVLKGLHLVPEDIPDQAKGAEVVKRTLSNLSQLVYGLGELRALYGSGHGRSSRHRGLTARHARLAVGAAATFVEFLVETHLARQTDVDRAA
jgi:hypothetical protein